MPLLDAEERLLIRLLFTDRAAGFILIVCLCVWYVSGKGVVVLAQRRS